jgi:hypothetical protein
MWGDQVLGDAGAPYGELPHRPAVDRPGLVWDRAERKVPLIDKIVEVVHV